MQKSKDSFAGWTQLSCVILKSLFMIHTENLHFNSLIAIGENKLRFLPRRRDLW